MSKKILNVKKTNIISIAEENGCTLNTRSIKAIDDKTANIIKKACDITKSFGRKQITPEIFGISKDKIPSGKYSSKNIIKKGIHNVASIKVNGCQLKKDTVYAIDKAVGKMVEKSCLIANMISKGEIHEGIVELLL